MVRRLHPNISLMHCPFCFWWGGFTSRCALPCTCRKSLETFFKLMKLCEMLGAGRYHTSTYCPYKGTQAVPMNARPLAVQLEIKRQQAEAQRSKKKGGSGGSCTCQHACVLWSALNAHGGGACWSCIMNERQDNPPHPQAAGR